MRPLLAALVLLACATASAQVTPELAAHTREVPGGILPGREPDGNSFILAGPRGVTVIDTGRHAAHRVAIEAVARSLHQPIVAIINTHWHLDHTSGNADLRALYPGLKVYASPAINDALTGFLAYSATQARAILQQGKLDATTQEEMRTDLATVDDGVALKPDVVIDHTQSIAIGGLRLQLHLVKDAATAGDIWVFDPANRIAFVGDLVTFPAPFFDTACSEGWSAALAEISQTPFVKIAPGHGPILTRAEFETYRSAFNALIACSASNASASDCASAWIDTTAPLANLSSQEKAQGREMALYYITDVLRPNHGNSAWCARKT